jgi:hypothetical protein
VGLAAEPSPRCTTPLPSSASLKAITAVSCVADASCMWVADLDYPRYKYMVQVVMGEQRGEGVR